MFGDSQVRWGRGIRVRNEQYRQSMERLRKGTLTQQGGNRQDDQGAKHRIGGHT